MGEAIPSLGQKGKPRGGGWLLTVVVVTGLLVLDFSPAVTVLDQEALGGFVSSVGNELLRQYIDKTVQSGVFSRAQHEPVVQKATQLLSSASNLTASPVDAGRANLKLGEVQSRYLNDWEAALHSFLKAETLLPTTIEPIYQLARCYIELAQYEKAAEKLREAIKMGASREGDSEMYFHSCLGPYELSKLIFGPANKDHIVESAKRFVQLQEGDNELVSDGLSRAINTCPPSMHQVLMLYRQLAEWNLPRNKKRVPKDASNFQIPKKDKKKKSKSGQVAKKVVLSFLEFVEKSELRKLALPLQQHPSTTVVQLGMPPSWGEEGDAPEKQNSQPLKADYIVNPLSFAEGDGPTTASPAATEEEEGHLVPQPRDSDVHWHEGYKRLSLYDCLFGKIDTLKHVADSDCTKQHLLLSYDSFIEANKKVLISILENEHRSILTTWKNHNQQLRVLCLPEVA